MNITKNDLKKINDFVWEIPKSFRADMRAPARIFATEKLLEEIFRDRSMEQLVNVATLPGIQKHALVMPDAHEGYGFPIGGVAAMDLDEGVISPGGIGYDINCGVRLLRSPVKWFEVEDKLEELATEIYHAVPSGLGRGGRLVFDKNKFDLMLGGGAGYLVEEGFGKENDVLHLEAQGNLSQADPSLVSNEAKRRGKDQLGTLGSGNHFLEVQRVDEIFEETAAKAFGLFKDQLVILIHTGSRGLGHQIATDYIRLMMSAMPKYGIVLPDRELACAPFRSPEGQKYFAAMCAGANFAWANRQTITHWIRESWRKVLGDLSGELEIVYDVAHNIAKIERYKIDGKEKELCVHRKGATRAFGAGNSELPDDYKGVGQPVLIPGSMGTASYVLVGTNESAELSFSTSCHGAGRRMSRHGAKKIWRGSDLKKQLEAQGIIVRAGSMSGLAEEAPLAYKDVEEVVGAVHGAGLAKKVARLKPLAVIKG